MADTTPPLFRSLSQTEIAQLHKQGCAVWCLLAAAHLRKLSFDADAFWKKARGMFPRDQFGLTFLVQQIALAQAIGLAGAVLSTRRFEEVRRLLEVKGLPILLMTELGPEGPNGQPRGILNHTRLLRAVDEQNWYFWVPETYPVGEPEPLTVQEIEGRLGQFLVLVPR